MGQSMIQPGNCEFGLLPGQWPASGGKPERMLDALTGRGVHNEVCATTEKAADQVADKFKHSSSRFSSEAA